MPQFQNHPIVHQLAAALRRRYDADSRAAPSEPIIVFVGAGASLCSGMVDWNTINADLFRAAASCYKTESAFVDAAWDALRPYIGPAPQSAGEAERRSELLRRATPEQLCAVASAIAPSRHEVIEVLRNEYELPDEERSRPQLAYELLAHLLRHRFIDDIVAFNFDEVLDRALENELGPDGFELIVSDQHPRHELCDSNRRVPRLIKLHGTISVPASLRFTADQTNSVSPDILRLLDDTAFGINESCSIGETERPSAQIVSLGYGWKDPDIVRWVASRTDRISKLTVVRRQHQYPPLLRDAVRATNKKWIKQRINIISTKLDAGGVRPGGYATIDEFLWALWYEVEQLLKGAGSPYVPASRHIVLGNVFGPNPEKLSAAGGLQPLPKKTTGAFTNDHTLRRRLDVEMYLHLVKAKGMTNLSVMSGDHRIHRHRDGSPWEVPWLRRSTAGPAKETFFARARTNSELLDGFNELGLRHVEHLHVPQFSSNGHVRINAREARQFFRSELQTILDAPEVEMATMPDPRTDWLFRNAQFISRYRTLQDQTHELLRQPWTDLFLVAESGSWLSHPRFLDVLRQRPLPRGRIFLITASDEGFDEWHLWPAIRESVEGQFDEIRGMGYAVDEAHIPWWRHNRHLTLALMAGDAGHYPSHYRFIYFRRHLKRSVIAPVAGQGDAACRDWTEVLLIFMGYLQRAYERASHRAADGRDDLDRACKLVRATLERIETLRFPPELKDQADAAIRTLQQLTS